MVGDVRAGELALKVITQQCRVVGLEAAQRVQLCGGEFTPEAIDAEIARLTAKLGGDDVTQVAIESAAPADPPVWPGSPQAEHPWGHLHGGEAITPNGALTVTGDRALESVGGCPRSGVARAIASVEASLAHGNDRFGR